MTKILVLYYSAYGHMETMAKAAAEGVVSAGAEATLKRVPELVPDDVARSSGMKIDQDAPVARPEELADYDGLIVGVSTRYSMMAAQLKNFFDQTGSLWMSGALIGKAASVMSSTATQHGGQEIALVTTQILLQHQGYVIVPLSYAFKEQMGVDVVKGGSPYGATTMADGDGSRMPSDVELDAARFQGKFTAEIAAKLAA